MDTNYLIGQRVEIPVHTDTWMSGNRYGEIVHIYRGGKMCRVELDKIGSIRLPLDTFGLEWHTV